MLTSCPHPTYVTIHGDYTSATGYGHDYYVGQATVTAYSVARTVTMLYATCAAFTLLWRKVPDVSTVVFDWVLHPHVTLLDHCSSTIFILIIIKQDSLWINKMRWNDFNINILLSPETASLMFSWPNQYDKAAKRKK